MKTFLNFVVALALATVSLSAQPYGATDPVTGLYEGTWTARDGQGTVSSQIRSLGDNSYDGFIKFEKDGATISVMKISSGKTVSPPDGNMPLDFRGSSLAPKDGAASKGDIRGNLERGTNGAARFAGTMTGDLGEGKFETKKIEKRSPTLGAKPPKGAVVLFDGSKNERWEDFKFSLPGDGTMQVQGGNMQAKDKFDNFKLHVEFRTPFMAKSQGQARGNSGVYLQSVYEVQVLDSFGLYPLQVNDCGSVYGVKAAEGNACLPPMEWQTYDIVFRNEGGNAENPPTITVAHNGVKTIDQAKVPADKIGKGGGGGNPKGGVLMLQNHGNPVQFRNIWVLPLKD